MLTLRDHINKELDRQYRRTAGGMLDAVNRLSRAQGSRVQKRLSSLVEEANRLQEAGERFTPDNAEIIAIQVESARLFNETETMILAYDNDIQGTAAEVGNIAVMATIALTLNNNILPANVAPFSKQAQNIYEGLLARYGIDWRTVDPTKVQAILNYVESEAWLTKMSKWGDGMAERINTAILQGVQKGRTPIGLAGYIRKLIEGMPAYAAENLTRTLQLTALRDIETALATDNQDYIQYKVRRAAKDSRTCFACILLDGTRLQPWERIDDHHNGRCFATYIMTNGQGDTSKQTGLDWFNSLSPERQAQQASFKNNYAKYKAWQEGRISLSDLVGEHNDSVFGHMFHERSLKDVLGDSAKEFYKAAGQ
jgi:hypothetical protein